MVSHQAHNLKTLVRIGLPQQIQKIARQLPGDFLYLLRESRAPGVITSRAGESRPCENTKCFT